MGDNQCREVTYISKDEPTLSAVMKSLCKITKSIGSIESQLDKLENITKKATEIIIKKSRVEERLNEHEKSHEFLGSKYDDQQVQLNKILKENKDMAKENLLLNKKTWVWKRQKEIA